MQSVLLRLIPFATLGIVVATACQRTPPPETIQVPVAETLLESTSVMRSDSCALWSGIAFRLQKLTLNPYGRDAVRASFSQSTKRTSVPGEFLWKSSLGRMTDLPNGGIFPTDSIGSMTVTVTVVDTSLAAPAEHPLAEAIFELPLTVRHVWWITSIIAPRLDRKVDELIVGSPARYVAKPLPGGDSIYVTAYGRRQRCGVIFY